MKRIYMDHNATTPVEPDVIETMSFAAREFWANPSSGHPLGRAAREELERRRAVIADFIGAKPSEIIFTAGGTEADNLAIIGGATANKKKGRHILVSPVEHHAVMESLELLQKEGFDIAYLPVDQQGRVDPDDVRKAIREETVLVTVMHANNEVGTLQPVAEIGRIARDQGILFHCDAAQSVGKIPVNVDEMHVDLLACSSHKIYGPKGLGFLYVRQGTEISPLLVGGGQELGRRSGTENIPAIAGLAKALEIADQKMDHEGKFLAGLRDSLFKGLSHSLEGLHVNGHPVERLPGTLSLSIDGVKSPELIARLNALGVCLSASAACATSSIKPSHVLTAMDVPLQRAAGTLRISLGRSNSREEIPQVVAAVTASVNELRSNLS